MKIHLIAIGKHLSNWVEAGYQEYAKRLPADYKLCLHEITAGKRGKNVDIQRLLDKEGEAMLAAIPSDSYVIALNVLGKSWDTPALAKKLFAWHENNQDISLLVGGPEGLAPQCLARADAHWSLSALTLPHPLVRIVIAEQLYRAWSILLRHPYHRA